jgi:hypothetical protein
MIKKQSLLETMLPLSSWAPATIKIQSELETVLSLNLWISAMIKKMRASDIQQTGKGCSASLLPLVKGHSTPLQSTK